MSDATKPAGGNGDDTNRSAEDAGQDDVKDAFRAALERKKAAGGGGKGVGGGGGGSTASGSTKAAGGRRTFQRKSGSS